ncbi:MAG TPA: DUF1360 domain-containing protein [Thermoanaerobaculia bacterium]|nr:DUF1360 domain-containing protein [Thermoanaerobaculia bacterium]
MRGFDFLLGSLATWRVAALLVREDGPFDLIARLRRALARLGAGRALECFFCTSLWVAAPVALWLAGATRRWLLVWLALSGAAGLLERASAPREAPVVDLAEAERLNEVTG